MAGCTVVDDAGMIEGRRREAAACAMTDVAVLRRRHVVRRGTLAGGIDTIMAGVTALTKNLRAGVVDERIGEVRGVMADAAVLAVRGRMRRRQASGPGVFMVQTAVVTRLTVAGNTRMRECRRYKSSDRVAAVAILPGRQVALRLEQVRPC